MLKALNVLAEVLGLFSAVALLIPAWENNDTLRKVHLLKAIAKKAKGLLGQAIEETADAATKIRPKWTARDQALLFAGALLLLASFVLKVYVALKAPS